MRVPVVWENRFDGSIFTVGSVELIRFHAGLLRTVVMPCIRDLEPTMPLDAITDAIDTAETVTFHVEPMHCQWSYLGCILRVAEGDLKKLEHVPSYEGFLKPQG